MAPVLVRALVVPLHQLLEQVARQRFAAVMGIVNATPNSFFDGGKYEAESAVKARVAQVIADGATIVDIGGESSKPGAPAVSASVQIDRIAPALAYGKQLGALLSVDTASAEVADYALTHGAQIVNDVTCLADSSLAQAVARHNGQLILSHSRAHQSHMPGFSEWPDDAYGDVVLDVLDELNRARVCAVELGVSPAGILFDPGLGFSKNAKHCYELLARTDELVAEGTAWVIGTGRKSFLSTVDNSDATHRLGGTVAASLAASQAGAQIIRTHDVQEMCQALAVDATLRAARPPLRQPLC